VIASEKYGYGFYGAGNDRDCDWSKGNCGFDSITKRAVAASEKSFTQKSTYAIPFFEEIRSEPEYFETFLKKGRIENMISIVYLAINPATIFYLVFRSETLGSNRFFLFSVPL